MKTFEHDISHYPVGPDSIVIDNELELRRFALSDVAKMYKVIDESRSDLATFLPFMADYTYETLWSDTASTVNQHDEGLRASYEIAYNGSLVGAVNLFDREADRAEIGYWLGTPWQGRGIMSRSVEGLVRVGFRQLGLNSVYMDIEPENSASQQVAKHAGFQHVSNIDATDVDGKSIVYQHWERSK